MREPAIIRMYALNHLAENNLSFCMNPITRILYFIFRSGQKYKFPEMTNEKSRFSELFSGFCVLYREFLSYYF